MAAILSTRGVEPEAEMWRPWKSTEDLANLHLAMLRTSPDFLEAFEDLLKVLNVNRQIRAGDQNVVNVDTDNGMPAMTMSIRLWNDMPVFFRPKGPNGVMTAYWDC